MDRAGDKFLAGTGFPVNQYGYFRRRDTLDQFINPLHYRTGSDQVFEFSMSIDTGAELLVLFLQLSALGDVANMVGILREVMVMNTGAGNTAVNYAYFAGLLALAFNPGKK